MKRSVFLMGWGVLCALTSMYAEVVTEPLFSISAAYDLSDRDFTKAQNKGRWILSRNAWPNANIEFGVRAVVHRQSAWWGSLAWDRPPLAYGLYDYEKGLSRIRAKVRGRSIINPDVLLGGYISGEALIPATPLNTIKSRFSPIWDTDGQAYKVGFGFDFILLPLASRIDYPLQITVGAQGALNSPDKGLNFYLVAYEKYGATARVAVEYSKQLKVLVHGYYHNHAGKIPGSEELEHNGGLGLGVEYRWSDYFTTTATGFLDAERGLYANIAVHFDVFGLQNPQNRSLQSYLKRDMPLDVIPLFFIKETTYDGSIDGGDADENVARWTNKQTIHSKTAYPGTVDTNATLLNEDDQHEMDALYYPTEKNPTDNLILYRPSEVEALGAVIPSLDELQRTLFEKSGMKELLAMYFKAGSLPKEPSELLSQALFELKNHTLKEKTVHLEAIEESVYFMRDLYDIRFSSKKSQSGRWKTVPFKENKKYQDLAHVTQELNKKVKQYFDASVFARIKTMSLGEQVARLRLHPVASRLPSIVNILNSIEKENDEIVKSAKNHRESFSIKSCLSSRRHEEQYHNDTVSNTSTRKSTRSAGGPSRVKKWGSLFNRVFNPKAGGSSRSVKEKPEEKPKARPYPESAKSDMTQATMSTMPVERDANSTYDVWNQKDTDSQSSAEMEHPTPEFLQESIDAIRRCHQILDQYEPLTTTALKAKIKKQDAALDTWIEKYFDTRVSDALLDRFNTVNTLDAGIQFLLEEPDFKEFLSQKEHDDLKRMFEKRSNALLLYKFTERRDAWAKILDENKEQDFEKLLKETNEYLNTQFEFLRKKMSSRALNKWDNAKEITDKIKLLLFEQKNFEAVLTSEQKEALKAIFVQQTYSISLSALKQSNEHLEKGLEDGRQEVLLVRGSWADRRLTELFKKLKVRLSPDINFALLDQDCGKVLDTLCNDPGISKWLLSDAGRECCKTVYSNRNHAFEEVNRLRTEEIESSESEASESAEEEVISETQPRSPSRDRAIRIKNLQGATITTGRLKGAPDGVETVAPEKDPPFANSVAEDSDEESRKGRPRKRQAASEEKTKAGRSKSRRPQVKRESSVAFKNSKRADSKHRNRAESHKGKKVKSSSQPDVSSTPVTAPVRQKTGILKESSLSTEEVFSLENDTTRLAQELANEKAVREQEELARKEGTPTNASNHSSQPPFLENIEARPLKSWKKEVEPLLKSLEAYLISEGRLNSERKGWNVLMNKLPELVESEPCLQGVVDRLAEMRRVYLAYECHTVDQFPVLNKKPVMEWQESQDSLNRFEKALSKYRSIPKGESTLTWIELIDRLDAIAAQKDKSDALFSDEVLQAVIEQRSEIKNAYYFEGLLSRKSIIRDNIKQIYKKVQHSADGKTAPFDQMVRRIQRQDTSALSSIELNYIELAKAIISKLEFINSNDTQSVVSARSTKRRHRGEQTKNRR